MRDERSGQTARSIRPLSCLSNMHACMRYIQINDAHVQDQAEMTRLI